MPADTFQLHSRPAADKVIYLDFDGHTTTGTLWNIELGLGSAGLSCQDFDFDSRPWEFNDAELTRIERIWERVVEDFSPFDVDVTTEDPGVERLRNTGGTDTQWGIRVVVTNSTGDLFGRPGGAAYLNSFNWDSDTPCFVFGGDLGWGDEKYTAEAISHEVGHTLGLEHDGRGRAEYFAGQGSGATGWAPIMGVGYYRGLTQWSQGEYLGATNREDDLAIITGNNGFGYRPDDHGDDVLSATPAVHDGLNVIYGAGVIEQRTDVDLFAFSTGAGRVTLKAFPAAASPNLDIRAELLDAAGVRVAVANAAGGLGAVLSAVVPAGEYFLRVDGVGRGYPSTGYSDYGSLGQYSFTGTVHEMPSPVAPRGVGLSAIESTDGRVSRLRLEFDGPMDPATVNRATVRVTGPAGQTVSVVAVRPVAGSDRKFDIQIRPQALAGPGGLRVYVSPAVRSTWPLALDQDADGLPGEAEDYFAAGVYRADAVGGLIADAATTEFHLTIDRGMPITDLNVRVDLSHPYVSDLMLQLVSPTGEVVDLFARDGLDGRDLRQTRFDDAATEDIGTAPAPFSGVFRPASSLAELIGDDAQGVWTLRVTDAVSGATGQVNSWGLLVSTTAPREGVRLISVEPVNESGSAIAARVVGIELSFSSPMNPATLSAADVRVTGPTGAAVRVLGVSPIPGTGDTRFRVMCVGWMRAGAYTVRVGPYVADVFGNALDANDNGAFLEAADAVTTALRVDRDVYLARARVAIPQRMAGSVHSPLRVTAATTISDVAVEVNLRHPSVGDLIVVLIAPNGDRFVLINRPNVTGADMVRVVFTDSAASLLSGLGPFTGEFQPLRPLSALAGRSAQGTWRLEVHDTGTGEPGELLSWALYVKPQ